MTPLGRPGGPAFERYRRALLREVERRALPLGADTAYFGGGTPSLAPAGFFAELVSALEASGLVAPSPFVVVEANPEDLARNRGLARQWAREGVSGVSLGAQSLDDRRLRFLGRAHTGAEVRTAVSRLAEAAIPWVSLDLIYGTAGQAMEALRAELVEAASLPGLTHISAYELTVEPATPFGRRAAAGERLGARAGEGAGLFRTVHQTLAARGFPAYEASKLRRGAGAPLAPQPEVLERRPLSRPRSLGPFVRARARRAVLEPPQPGRLAGGARPGRIPHRGARNRRSRGPRPGGTLPAAPHHGGSRSRRVRLPLRRGRRRGESDALRRLGSPRPRSQGGSQGASGGAHRAPGAAGPDPLRARARRRAGARSGSRRGPPKDRGVSTVEAAPLTTKRIFWIWLPMAATWLMMSLEGLLIAAVVARLPEATVNLAAYGVAFGFALIVEAPIIMILSASTALCRDRDAFHALRRFGRTLNLLLSLLVIAAVASPLYAMFAEGVMGLDPEVSRLSRFALLVFLPWPAAIGYRRFYQGVMIRHGHTRRIAYGTTIRLLGMGVTAFLLFEAPIPGALIGAGALSVGVVFEAAATRLMAADCVRTVLATPRTGDPLTTPPDPPLLHPAAGEFRDRAGDPPAGEPVSRPLAPPPRVARHLSGGRLPLVRLPQHGAVLPGGGHRVHGRHPRAVRGPAAVRAVARGGRPRRAGGDRPDPRSRDSGSARWARSARVSWTSRCLRSRCWC